LDDSLGSNRARQIEQLAILGIGDSETAGLIEAGSDFSQRNLLDLRIGWRWR
jgi:hypothetical protein